MIHVVKEWSEYHAPLHHPFVFILKFFPLVFYVCCKKMFFLNFFVSIKDTCNWMKFVRPATNSKEQNLVVSQQGTSLYFTTIEVIQPMQELLVWYSEDYAQARNYKLLSTNSCCKCAHSFVVLFVCKNRFSQ